MLRNFPAFRVLPCQDKLRSYVSRDGYKESRSRNQRSKEPSPAGFEGPSGTTRPAGATRHRVPHELVKEDSAGRGSRERVPLRIHVSLPSDLVAVSLQKTVRGGRGAGNPSPIPACLPVTHLQAARFSGPLQWLQNRLLKSQSLLSAAYRTTSPSHGEVNDQADSHALALEHLYLAIHRPRPTTEISSLLLDLILLLCTTILPRAKATDHQIVLLGVGLTWLSPLLHPGQVATLLASLEQQRLKRCCTSKAGFGVKSALLESGDGKTHTHTPTL